MIDPDLLTGQMKLNFDEVPQQLLTADEMFSSLDERTLRRWLENCRFEKKSALIQPQSLGDYFSMWANTAPEGGIIVVGITKDDVFEGCLKVGVDKDNKIRKTGESHCPDAEAYIKQVPITRDSDGGADYVLAIRVKYNEKRVVRTTDQKVFIRLGDSIHELDGDEVRRLQSDKGEISFELEPCNLEYPSQFRMDLVNHFVASVQARKMWTYGHTTEEVLELMHLGTRKDGGFVPNIACALLFAKDPRLISPGARLRFLRFEGEQERTGEQWNAVRDEFIDGGASELIEGAERILRSQLRTFSRLAPNGKFTTAPEYPDFAWYEAVVNAVSHRSYGNGLKNSHIVVKMFDDRLVIESPGPFGPFVRPDNIYDIGHKPRNPFLMDALYYLNFVKMANEGTRRMRDEMRSLELPEPEFKQESIGGATVRVTLRNSVKQRKAWVDRDIVEILGIQAAHSLNANEKLVINFVAENGTVDVTDTQRLTGKDWGSSRKLLQGLVNRRYLEFVSYKFKHPDNHYRLARPEKNDAR